jgi:hypothetical protein
MRSDGENELPSALAMSVWRSKAKTTPRKSSSAISRLISRLFLNVFGFTSRSINTNQLSSPSVAQQRDGTDAEED